MKKNYFLPISILVSALIIAGAWIYTTGLKTSSSSSNTSSAVEKTSPVSNSQQNVLPSGGGGCGI